LRRIFGHKKQEVTGGWTQLRYYPDIYMEEVRKVITTLRTAAGLRAQI
jgi:hypothetical protein